MLFFTKVVIRLYNLHAVEQTHCDVHESHRVVSLTIVVTQ